MREQLLFRRAAGEYNIRPYGQWQSRRDGDHTFACADNTMLLHALGHELAEAGALQMNLERRHIRLEGGSNMRDIGGYRTAGLAVGLLLTALGVEQADVLADFALSTDLRVVDNELDRELLAALANTNLVARFYAETLSVRGMDAFKPRAMVDSKGRPLLSIAFAAIEDEWGSVAAYLESELRVGAAEVERLQALLLEPAGTVA